MLPPKEQIAEYSQEEERLNTITHALGIILFLIGIPYLLTQVRIELKTYQWVSIYLFGISLLFVYTSSTSYHAAKNLRNKWLLKKADHMAIYFLVVGSHTPFVLLYLDNQFGYIYLLILWLMALLGVLYKAFFFGRFPKLSLLYYLLLGWMAIFIVKPMLASMPLSILYWIIGGGCFYTIGALIYAWESLKYGHAIWHLFVIAGSFCHYLALFYAVS